MTGDMRGFYGLGPNFIPLEPEQRREITRERKRVDKEERRYREAHAEGLAQSGPPSVLDPFIDAANAQASVLPTRKQQELQRLGLVEQADGRVLHVSEVRRREVQREREDDYEQGGVSREEYHAFLAREGLEDEDE